MSAIAATPIFVCPEKSATDLATLAASQGWSIAAAQDLPDTEQPRVALVEVHAGEDARILRRQFPHALLVADPGTEAPVDFVVPRAGGPQDALLLDQVLHMAAAFWRKNLKVNELVREVGMRRQRMHQLNEISLALTTHMGQDELLDTILTEARRIAGCQGASLFLIEPDDETGQALVFKLAQNDVVDFPAVEARLPLAPDSIAGYVAVNGQELNIRDVYLLSSDLPSTLR